MSAEDSRPRALARPEWLAVLAFFSASLVFLVEPMVGKLLLPMLGGSPAVWNTSMAFFQGGLLLGYLYAHWLQRFAPRRQAIIHLGALILAAAALPLRVIAFGQPSLDHPNLWLVGALLLSIGAPFAVLSATAPLLQAWHARVFGGEGREPYALYAASNLGSLLALLAYPLVVEPAFTLSGQRYGWSMGYLGFALLLIAVAFALSRRSRVTTGETLTVTAPPTWARRAGWIATAALPSSLMLGLTTLLATDVASVPLVWVVPLALYLLTFVVAFQSTPSIRPSVALNWQAVAVPVCAFVLFLRVDESVQLLIQCTGFFVSALVCHQRLVASRPGPDRLTEFYLCLSIGGVLGGAFNAFVAPVIFNDVIEFPLVLALVVLARPGLFARPRWHEWASLVIGLLAIALFAASFLGVRNPFAATPMWAVFAAVLVAGVGLRRQALLLFIVIAGLLLVEHTLTRPAIRSERDFFGVMRQEEHPNAALGGRVRLLIHGSTVHGTEALNPAFHCEPLSYYGRQTAIGTTISQMLRTHPKAQIGAVGLGVGVISTYTRPGDRLSFFEIDPLVVKIASRSGQFSYTTDCAHGQIDYVLGDARLSLEKVAPGSYDLLLIDAFSSNAVPTHLLTIEALKLYLSRIKPDGVLVLHVSNRVMDLTGPAMAGAAALGAPAVQTTYIPSPGEAAKLIESEEVVLIGRSAAALAPYVPTGSSGVTDAARPWTDDYTNIVGAILARRTHPIPKRGG